MNRKHRIRLDALLGAGAAIAVLLLAAFYNAGGFLHFESLTFFHQYLADRPLAALILDPCRNDWGCYQARELSYFFDWLDAHFLAFSFRHGVIHFYSLTWVVFLALTVLIQQYGSRKLFPQLPGWFLLVLSLLFVLTPCAWDNIYFRSAKFGCTLAVTATAYLTLALVLERGGLRRSWLIAGIGGALLLGTAFDRQGAFFAAAYCGAAGLYLLLALWLRSRGRTIPDPALKTTAWLAGTALTVMLIGCYYNRQLGPELIYAANGYYPSFEFQSSADPLNRDHLWGALQYLLSNLGQAFTTQTGSPAAVAGAAILLLLAAVLGGALLKLRSLRFTAAAGLGALAIVGSWIAAAGMYARHPALLWPDVIYSAYFLPTWSLFIPLLALTAELERRTAKRPLLPLLLALALAIRVGGYFFPRPDPPQDHQATIKHRLPAFKRALTDPGYDYRPDLLPREMELLIEYFQPRAPGTMNHTPRTGGADPGPQTPQP